ncbi:uncharacterized protein LOC111356326 [Spodoptera litura]|uniref:Uncharacterized protein LOC111356326 n=1 Tax=Spodoptera litura TaxID=69820 RepID=A0A9J7E8K2_SPOLT|nr:uncharacterized protein LOC111356326 [Spodoptera litura]
MTTGIPTHPVPVPPADVLAISIASRIPDFWGDQPRVWFIRVEAVLAPQKLGDDAKFDLVVSKLPKDVIMQLSDFLTKPPETGKFLALKTKLFTLLEDSKTRQIEKLIGEMELGDQKPSQLLHRMRDLARDKIPDDTLRVLWQGHLPSTVRAVLVVSETKDLDNLAVIADNVAEATRMNQVSAVGQKPTAHEQPEDSVTIATIAAELAKMNARLTNMERSRSRMRQDGYRHRQASRSSSRRRVPGAANRLCSYHFRYRHRAHRCIPPCAWKSKPAVEGNTNDRARSEN